VDGRGSRGRLGASGLFYFFHFFCVQSTGRTNIVRSSKGRDRAGLLGTYQASGLATRRHFFRPRNSDEASYSATAVEAMIC